MSSSLTEKEDFWAFFLKRKRYLQVRGDSKGSGYKREEKDAWVLGILVIIRCPGEIGVSLEKRRKDPARKRRGGGGELLRRRKKKKTLSGGGKHIKKRGCNLL